METKQELLSKLLDDQLSLVGCLNAGRVGYSATPSDSNRLLNAILGVEALTNAIAALPLTPEEQGQVIDSPSGQFIEQSNEQETRNCWQIDLDNLPSNREPTHSSDDDAGW